jgi:hypothetical protein
MNSLQADYQVICPIGCDLGGKATSTTRPSHIPVNGRANENDRGPNETAHQMRRCGAATYERGTPELRNAVSQSSSRFEVWTTPSSPSTIRMYAPVVLAKTSTVVQPCGPATFGP